MMQLISMHSRLRNGHCDTSMTVDEKLAAMIAKIGENMNIRRFEKIVSEDGIVVSYIHGSRKVSVFS